MGDKEETRKRLVVESLGWITESSIMPKKHRAIEGVGPSSIMELKAQLYKSQEEAKQTKDLTGSDAQYHRAKERIAAKDSYSAKNSGVESRALKDKIELKAVKDGAVSYAALERKAEIYDKLVRGELSDEEVEEKYCVDFYSKGSEHVEDSQPSSTRNSSISAPPEDGEDDASLFSTKFAGLGRAIGTADISQHVRIVREVHEEVNQAREKATELKQKRQEQATNRREKLKQAYLRKQLEKLKAQQQQQQQQQTQKQDEENT